MFYNFTLNYSPEGSFWRRSQAGTEQQEGPRSVLLLFHCGLPCVTLQGGFRNLDITDASKEVPVDISLRLGGPGEESWLS